jgi:hypothetical protein
MSRQLINRSPDLKRLQDEGYDIEIRSGHLLIKDVPYVAAGKEIRRGVLVSTLSLAGDATTTPGDHVATFAGEVPCDREGRALNQILNASVPQQLAPNLVINHTFSSKPTGGGYRDYYDKMTTYVNIICGHAHALDPTVTPKTFPVIQAEDEESVFRYIDSATSRAGIDVINRKLELEKVALVGLGGTGAYVFDLVAKTRVREIHLFDGDRFLQHNAFRSPGAPSIEDLRTAPFKVDLLFRQYDRMRRHIVPHSAHIDESNVGILCSMDFVFLCLDDGEAKRFIVTKLQEFQRPFVDVGIGVYETGGALAGLVRVTASTCDMRDHIWEKDRIPFSTNEENNEYSRNIQIADLTALNAALAVIKWKKLFGFYQDLEGEHYSVYEIDGNHLLNEDQG